MSSLADNRPPITHAVTKWLGGFCRSDGCFNPVDVSWLPDGFTQDELSALATHCPECRVSAATEQERHGLIVNFNGLRKEREFLDLSNPLRRLCLFGDVRPFPTLFMNTWRPPASRGLTSALDQYFLIGVIDHGPGGAPDPAAFLASPRFEMVHIESIRTLVRVYLVDVFRDSQFPTLTIHVGIDTRNPTAYPQQIPEYSGPTTPKQTAALFVAVSKLYALRRRPPGTTTYSRERFRESVERERAEFAVDFGRPPHDTELAARVGVSESTFKRYKRRGWLSGSA